MTNDGESALARGADLTLATDAGREFAVPATKTYTTQLAAMAVLATALAPDPTSLDADLARVPAHMSALVERREGVDAAAAQLAKSAEMLVSGRGLLFGTALEVALKLEETCRGRYAACRTPTCGTARSRSSTPTWRRSWSRRRTARWWAASTEVATDLARPGATDRDRRRRGVRFRVRAVGAGAGPAGDGGAAGHRRSRAADGGEPGPPPRPGPRRTARTFQGHPDRRGLKGRRASRPSYAW